MNFAGRFLRILEGATLPVEALVRAGECEKHVRCFSSSQGISRSALIRSSQLGRRGESVISGKHRFKCLRIFIFCQLGHNPLRLCHRDTDRSRCALCHMASAVAELTALPCRTIAELFGRLLRIPFGWRLEALHLRGPNGRFGKRRAQNREAKRCLSTLLAPKFLARCGKDEHSRRPCGQVPN